MLKIKLNYYNPMSTILITGCKGGIGLNSAIRLAKLGNKVYATVHHEESVAGIKKIMEPYGNNVITEKLDITDAGDREKINHWDIDVLINNAGIGDSGPLVEIDVQRVREVFETDIFATLQVTQLAAKKMILKGKGRIIIISSMYGLAPTPFIAPYGMAKFAQEDMGLSLRKELKPFGVYVTLINPGAYDTGFNQKNINKKKDWMTNDTLYKNNMDEIKKYEDLLIRLQVKNTDSIAKKVVKAATVRKPKKRYYAPMFQWILTRLSQI